MGHQASVTGPDEAQTAATETRNAGAGRAPGQGRQMGKAQDLTLNNTLTKNKDLFKPLDKHGVTWYTCGPTVYDSAHLGHARYYVTMDMLRRVMEAHFDFEINFVMNVTDIDDKIITRARSNHLRDQYRLSTPDDSKDLQLLEEVLEAMTEAVQKQQSTRDEMQQREDKNLQTKQKNLRKAQSLRDSWHENSSAPAESGASPGISSDQPASRRDRLIEVGGDVLAEKLDILHGSEVIDHSVITKHAEKFEREFFEDLETLGCKTPSMVMRVTEYIPEITDYIDKIHQKGMAYTSNGSVYFDTQAFEKMGHVYGKVAPPKEVESQPQAGDGEADFNTADKRNPRDFALWKAAKPGEPSWPSPECAQDASGRGRPGWHIECSAMASHVFKESMDIHSGGVDLAFPHHTNEVAQTEAYFHHECCGGGKPLQPQWVNYFLHAGHLNINGCKMSKSKKNFITIRKALERIDARVLRLMFARAPWELPMKYTAGETEAEARSIDNVFKRFFARAQAILAKFPLATRPPATEWLDKDKKKSLSAELASAHSTVEAALQDSINLFDAVEALFDLVKCADSCMEGKKETHKDLESCAVLLREVTEYIAQILSKFGIDGYTFVVPAAVEGFARFRGTMRDYAKSGLAGSSEPRDALQNILQAVDRVWDEDMQALGNRLTDRSWIIKEISEINSEDHTSGGAEGNPESSATALQAFASFCCTVRNHTESGLASSRKPRDALSNILQAADRVRDENMPEMGFWLDDCAEGSWLPWFIIKMSAVEQRKFRDPEAAAGAKEEIQLEKAREAEQERQSKHQDKLKRLEKEYASLQATEDPKKKVKHIKDVWAALKPPKKGPEDHTFGPEERRVVEEILSGSRYVHEKQLQGFEALWAGLNRANASDAEKQKAEKELLQKIKEALPEATEPWLVQIVSEFRTSW